MAVSDWVRAVLQRGQATHSRGGLGEEVPRICQPRTDSGQDRGHTATGRVGPCSPERRPTGCVYIRRKGCILRARSTHSWRLRSPTGYL